VKKKDREREKRSCAPFVGVERFERQDLRDDGGGYQADSENGELDAACVLRAVRDLSVGEAASPLYVYG
jgi:hypothetical protein